VLVGYLSASALTDIYYVARRQVGAAGARKAVWACLDAFAVCMVDGATREQAYALPGADLEDNLQIAVAVCEALDAIVTRDQEGFRGSQAPALTPADLLARLGA
jgi:hypothetical protein